MKEYSMNKRILLSGLICLLFAFRATAQLNAASRELLAEKEDSLRILADSMINALSPADRFRADSSFVRGLVRALQVPHSIDYPFRSVATVSQLYPKDSSFRIFTWQLKKDEYVYHQKGAIQVRTTDGRLKLFPLFDASMFTTDPNDSVRSRNNWIGAIYYTIIQKEHNGKSYYTLLGFDDFSIASNKKWMEVLTFNANGEPVFGGPLISYAADSTGRKIKPRFSIEYKKEANTVFNYNPEMDMIIFDHLISETNEPDRKETYIPDGDYEGFKWENGRWVHVDKVFNFSLQDGQFPQESTIRDAEGNINEKILEEASRRNMEKADSSKPAPKRKRDQ